MTTKKDAAALEKVIVQLFDPDPKIRSKAASLVGHNSLNGIGGQDVILKLPAF